MTRLVDLSTALTPVDASRFPEPIKPLLRILAPEIEYIDNQKGAEIMMQLFGCPKEHLPDGEGWGEDNISMSTHTGTHVDAPLHYGSKTGDQKAKSLDEIDLEDLYMPACVLDLTAKKGTGSAILVYDLQKALEKIEHDITPGEAVLLRTDHDKFELTNPIKYNYPGLMRDSALWLVEQGAKAGGTDATGWDRPFHVMIEEYKATSDKSLIWDAHFAHRDREFYVIQQLTNLDKLPPKGFKVGFFPIKLVGTSAAPCRAVAFIDDD